MTVELAQGEFLVVEEGVVLVGTGTSTWLVLPAFELISAEDAQALYTPRSPCFPMEPDLPWRQVLELLMLGVESLDKERMAQMMTLMMCAVPPIMERLDLRNAATQVTNPNDQSCYWVIAGQDPAGLVGELGIEPLGGKRAEGKTLH